MQGMKIDFVTSSIIITKAFRDAAAEYGSEEYIALNMVKEENPSMKIVLRSTEMPKRSSKYKGLTYKYMRKFISVMDSGNLLNFENTILYFESFDYSNGEVYQNVKDWFLANYPNHKDMVVNFAPKITAA